MPGVKPCVNSRDQMPKLFSRRSELMALKPIWARPSVAPGLQQRLVERAMLDHGHVDLVAELARDREPADARHDGADVHGRGSS